MLVRSWCNGARPTGGPKKSFSSLSDLAKEPEGPELVSDPRLVRWSAPPLGTPRKDRARPGALLGLVSPVLAARPGIETSPEQFDVEASDMTTAQNG